MLYIKTTLTVPGVGSSVHIAELEPLNTQVCKMHRMIEMDPSGTIRGVAQAGTVKGAATMPLQEVPHPDTYEQFEDIEAEHIDAKRFEALWIEAHTTLR
ncbi:hypothetical protein [Corynebacterium gerontici]|uniref:Uncharacterized protein n=1 Tax=Corynebacterium gerontici TaxID=2079234 RepID=A0A3G6J326_9CORY|nr:hypothetical protein [Corynebacterium gerontici]AZA12417.1 hypothetical protein CGERO_10690 [Corynebacterium gerontici]